MKSRHHQEQSHPYDLAQGLRTPAVPQGNVLHIASASIPSRMAWVDQRRKEKLDRTIPSGKTKALTLILQMCGKQEQLLTWRKADHRPFIVNGTWNMKKVVFQTLHQNTYIFFVSATWKEALRDVNDFIKIDPIFELLLSLFQKESRAAKNLS